MLPVIYDNFEVVSNALAPDEVEVETDVAPVGTKLAGHLDEPEAQMPDREQAATKRPPFTTLLTRPTSPARPTPFARPFTATPHTPVTLPSIISAANSRDRAPCIRDDI